MTEAEFQREVVALAKSRGWDVFHVPRSDRGGVTSLGFPDLICRRQHRLIVAELKSDRGRMREGQQEWLGAFTSARIPTYLARPKDWAALYNALTADL